MFVLKKLIGNLFMPLSLISLFLIGGCIILTCSRKQKTGKLIIILCTLLIITISYGIVPNMLLYKLENFSQPFVVATFQSEHGEILRNIKRIVVLGGGHSTDERFPCSSQMTQATLIRLIEGVRIYRQLPGTKLILSGGKIFDSKSDAELMENLALDFGVIPEDIILENDSRDTEEQACLIASLVGKQPFILITCAAHMRRSLALFKSRGMNPIPAPVGHLTFEDSRLSPDDFFPNHRGVRNFEILLHEYLGIIWSSVRGRIQ